MSNISKRPTEESNHSSPSTRHPHEDSGSHPSMKFETGQDSRAGKASRSETRDVDKRSPLHSTYRISESHASHMIAGTENRLESRDSKDGRENKVDSRDTKAEPRELYHQVAKVDKDGKFQVRVDDTKEAKHNRETGGDPKSDSRAEKDLYGSGSGHINWKDHHKGKRHADAGFGNSDWRLWGITKEHSHGTADVSKEGSNNNEREQVQISENTGENKMMAMTMMMPGENKSDFKGDDKYKDRDRKRKEGKHRDWAERDKVDHKDSMSAPPAGYAYKEMTRELREEREGAERDRVDHRDSLPVLPSGSTYKELAREEREGERWEKDKKCTPKEKDRSKDRERGFPNREAWNSVEKEGSHYEKEIADRSSEQGNVVLDQKRPREGDDGRNTDKEARERRKEPDGNVDGERPEKRNRLADKDADEWVGDVEAGVEQEKEGFTSAVQQKKRMLRPRGSPQVTNRDQRLKPHGPDGDGLQVGKSEVPTIVYKVGECLQDLFKVWKDYASSQTDKNGESSLGGPNLEVKIPGEHVTATNRQVRGGQLWGTDVYTDDSDLVAVLMHMGYCRTTPNPPPPALQEVRVIIRVLPPQDYYVSSLRNNVRSRAWGAGIGCSYRVERCFLVKKGCEPREIERSLSYSSTIEPTLAPVAVERTMTTRAAASNALRQQRFVREVTLQYNLSNEPWIKYTINVVADRGLKKPMFTSARLKKGEVLYMETHFHRYELCFMAEKVIKAGSAPAHETEPEKPLNHHNSHAANGESRAADGETVDVFRFSRCKKNLPQGIMRQRGIPLPSELLEVLEDNLDWEDVLWSQTGVWIRGKNYHLARVHFMSPN